MHNAIHCSMAPREMHGFLMWRRVASLLELLSLSPILFIYTPRSYVCWLKVVFNASYSPLFVGVMSTPLCTECGGCDRGGPDDETSHWYCYKCWAAWDHWCWICAFRERFPLRAVRSDIQSVMGLDNIVMEVSEYLNGAGGPFQYD